MEMKATEFKEERKWKQVDEFGPEHLEAQGQRMLAATGYAEGFVRKLGALQKEVEHHRVCVDTIRERLASGSADTATDESFRRFLVGEEQSLRESTSNYEETLKQLKQELSGMLCDSEQVSESNKLRSRLETMWKSDDAFCESVQSRYASVDDFLTALREQTVPLEILVSFLGAESRRFNKVTERAKESFLAWRQEYFLRSFDPDIQQYLRVSTELVRQRLQELAFTCIDSLAPQRGFGDYGSSVVRIDSDLYENDVGLSRHVVFHELTHAVLGNGYEVTIKDVELADKREKDMSALFGNRAAPGFFRQVPSAITRKSGVHFHLEEDGRRTKDQQIWMNEGLVELLAARMAGKRPRAYLEFIDEVWRMVDAGMEWQTLYEAAAEDLLKEPVNRSRIPAYDRMVRRMRELEGPGAMRRHVESIERKNKYRIRAGWYASRQGLFRDILMPYARACL
ncbi:hypothetical protein A2348_00420 [Candidatus Uhrbacteria bacterium RIFOXYB12_FULL_58_10]|nr:MAG: hypothetical protein A2348_00420 [Candidatus Uhrbacteria bacterium RIFOXYB12_FULL_58_10]